MTTTNARERSRACRLIALLSLVVGLGAGAECTALEWQPIGPGGGWVATIAVDPRRPATVYAGMARHGLYRSTDGGEHWSLLGFPTDWVAVIAFHPTEPDTLFVGTIGNQAGLARSRDRGATWTRFGSAIGTALVFDPADPETMFIGRDGCVLRTEGTGSARTWSPWCGGGLPMPDPIRALYFSARDRDAMFALTATHGRMESRNRGETWQASPPPSATSQELPEVALATVSLSSPSVVYAVPVAARESPVVKSTDGGRSWQTAGQGLSERPQALAIAPSDADVVYAVLADRRLFMTTDGGAHWSAAEAGLPRSLAAVVTIDPRDPRTVYAGTAGAGVFKTSDGGTSWRRISIGFGASMVTAVITAPWPRPALFALTIGGGPLVTTDGGFSWRSLMAGLPPSSDDVIALAADATRPGSVSIGTHEGVFQSDDTGVTWSAVAPHTLRTGVVALVVDPTPPRAVYAGLESGALVRQRGDGPWSFLHPAVAPGPGCAASWFPTPLVVDPRHPGTIYWGRSRSLDDGGSWTDLNPPGGFSALAADPTEDRAIYAMDTLGPDGRVNRSGDGGATWLPAGVGLPTGAANAFVVDPHEPATVYVAKDRSIYVSYDRGREWRVLDAEVSSVPVLALALDPVERHVLYAGTEGRGVLKTRVPPAPSAVAP